VPGRVVGKVAFITRAARGQGRTHGIRLAEGGAEIIAADVCEGFAPMLFPGAKPNDLDERWCVPSRHSDKAQSLSALTFGALERTPEPEPGRATTSSPGRVARTGGPLAALVGSHRAAAEQWVARCCAGPVRARRQCPPRHLHPRHVGARGARRGRRRRHHGDAGRDRAQAGRPRCAAHGEPVREPSGRDRRHRLPGLRHHAGGRSGTGEAAFGEPRVYASREELLKRFHLIPDQPVIGYVAEHVAATSVQQVADRWKWKFDRRIFGRSDSQHLLTRLDCRIALLRAEHRMVSVAAGEVMYDRLGHAAPVIEIPAAGHHIVLTRLPRRPRQQTDLHRLSPVSAPAT
jgi:hypothetical protein